MFGESVLAPARRVGGLYKLRVRFDHRKACRRLVEVWRVPFDCCKACRKIVKVRRVSFDYRKVCRLGGIWRVRFGVGNACIYLVQVWKVRFVHHKNCMKKFRASVLTATKRVEACRISESPF